MLRLRDIMTTDLLTLAPEVSVRDAMESLASRHVSGAPVAAGTKVVGVVSASDLMEFASELRDRDERAEVQALEGMNPDNRWDASEEPTGAFFLELWRDGDSDVSERITNSDSAWWSVLGGHEVSEAMTRLIRSLPPDTPVDQAAEYLRENGIHRVLVMDGEKLLGVVSTSDIASAVADHTITTSDRRGPKSGFDPSGWPGDTRPHTNRGQSAEG
jgi:CBS domain-containing protein